MKLEWEIITDEAEKYGEELDRWMEMTHETSRLNIYKEIDTYPCSSLVKMQMTAKLMTKIFLKGMINKKRTIK